MKRNKLLLVLLLFIISISLAACGKPSPASLGIENPARGGFAPISNSGLAVYGKGKINATDKTVSIEIDLSMLSKVNVGYSINLALGRENMFSGSIKTIPSVKDVGDSNKCTVTAALESNTGLETWENTEMDATINLPSKDGVFVVYNSCIQEGNDDKKYVWVSKKKYKEILTLDDAIMELTEVETGKTDGKKTEVTKGLNGYQSIFIPISNM